MAYHEIIIMRHGETEWNVESRVQGHLNSPLTPKGKAQAQIMYEKLVRNIPDFSSFAAVVSPLGRARETAQIILAKLEVNCKFDDRLKEVNFGSWQGKLEQEIFSHSPAIEQAKAREPIMWNFMSEDGEKYSDVEKRCKSFLEAIDRPTIIVAHSILSWVMRATWLKLGEGEINHLPSGQGTVYRLSEAGHQELH